MSDRPCRTYDHQRQDPHDPAGGDPLDRWEPIRGPSGRLHGMIELRTLRLVVKRKGEAPEIIDLRALLAAAGVEVAAVELGAVADSGSPVL